MTVMVLAMPGVAWGTAGHGPAVSAARLSAALGWRRAWRSGLATARTLDVVLCQAERRSFDNHFNAAQQRSLPSSCSSSTPTRGQSPRSRPSSGGRTWAPQGIRRSVDESSYKGKSARVIRAHPLGPARLRTPFYARATSSGTDSLAPICHSTATRTSIPCLTEEVTVQ